MSDDLTARAANCWCIVHNPDTGEHNSMPGTPRGWLQREVEARAEDVHDV